MGRQVKCQLCGQLFDKDTGIRIDEKNFHINCGKEYTDKKEIFKYVARLFGFKSETKPGPRITSQLKSFREKYSYTYEGILNALKYHFEVRKGSIDKANEGIGIVPYVYEEAQEYFKRFKNKQEKIAQSIGRQLEVKPEVLTIKKTSEEKKKKQTLYNLEQFNMEE